MKTLFNTTEEIKELKTKEEGKQQNEKVFSLEEFLVLQCE